jgi:Fur family ferric uptake transcriptional regulator
MIGKSDQNIKSAAASEFFLQALAALKNAGLKHTPVREVLLQFLLRAERPLSKDEIQDELKQQKKVNYDSVTLYRNLASFAEIGLVRKCNFGDGIARYEFSHPTGQLLHRLFCTHCKYVVNLEVFKLAEFEAKIKRLGYTHVTHAIDSCGVCPPCHKKANRG